MEAHLAVAERAAASSKAHAEEVHTGRDLAHLLSSLPLLLIGTTCCMRIYSGG